MLNFLKTCMEKDQKKKMVNKDDQKYVPRGKRVPKLTECKISTLTRLFLSYINVNRRNKSDLLGVIENLYGNERLPLIIDVVDDEKWNFKNIAEAIYQPQDFTITLPNSVYEGMMAGDTNDLFIFLHEVGHCFLAHGQNIMHYESDTPMTSDEDAEVQADRFAASVMKHLGIKNDDRQLSLFEKEDLLR